MKFIQAISYFLFLALGCFGGVPSLEAAETIGATTAVGGGVDEAGGSGTTARGAGSTAPSPTGATATPDLASHNVTGTVETVDAIRNSIRVRDSQNRQLEFTTAHETEITGVQGDATLDDIKPGSKVVIQFEPGTTTAQKINLAPAAD